MISKEESLNLLQKLITQKSSGKDKRSDEEFLKKPERVLIDNDEWFIYVPPCFNDCLDIAKTERVMKSKKKTQKVWTQGSRFAFHRGCILYDTPKAYHRWDVAISEIKYCISIQNAKNVKLEEGEREPGIVEFSIFSPQYMKMSLEKIDEYTLTQDEFVRFLIEGDPKNIPE